MQKCPHGNFINGGDDMANAGKYIISTRADHLQYHRHSKCMPIMTVDLACRGLLPWRNIDGVANRSARILLPVGDSGLQPSVISYRKMARSRAPIIEGCLSPLYSRHNILLFAQRPSLFIIIPFHNAVILAYMTIDIAAGERPMRRLARSLFARGEADWWWPIFNLIGGKHKL